MFTDYNCIFKIRSDNRILYYSTFFISVFRLTSQAVRAITNQFICVGSRNPNVVNNAHSIDWKGLSVILEMLVRRGSRSWNPSKAPSNSNMWEMPSKAIVSLWRMLSGVCGWERSEELLSEQWNVASSNV